MSALGRVRRRASLPLAAQIMILLLGTLVVAQVVTLGLTLLLPPTAPSQYRLADIAAALKGAKMTAHDARPLVRTVRDEPPSFGNPGWLVSERSRHALAQMVGAEEGDVRLLFYSPLPFAGAGGLAALSGSGAEAPLALTSATDQDAPIVLAAYSPPPAQPPASGSPGARGPGPPPGVPQLPAGGLHGGGAAPPPIYQGGPGRPGGPTSPIGFSGVLQLPGSGYLVPPSSPWVIRNQGGFATSSSAGSAGTATSAAVAGAAQPALGQSGGSPIGPGQAGVLGAPGPGYVISPPGGLSLGSSPAGAPPIGVPPIGAAPGAAFGAYGLAARPPAVSFPSFHLATSPSSAVDPEAALRREAGRAADGAAATGNDAATTMPAQSPKAPVAGEPRLATLASEAGALGLIVPAPLIAEGAGDSAGWVIGQPESQPRGLFGLGAATPFVEGDFVAAVRTGPARWVTVQPRPEPFPNSWQRRVLLWFVAASALTAPLAWLFARRLARPLGAFAAAAEQLGRDPSGAAANLAGPAEIGRAARAFNAMQSRLKRFIDDRTAMVGAISHDLRTPLARMRFRMERAPEALRAGMLNDIGQMEEMISSVLVFIRDASEPGVRERVDLRSILECVVDDAALIGGEAVLDPGDPVSVEVDSLSVQRVLANLVDNALKYGQRAEVRMYTEKDEAVAEIADDGPGLPPQELERVFLPFYRSESARTLNRGGIGLGLAVSRSIARAHGGDVKLLNNGHGVIAQLRLPLALRAA